MMRLLLVLVASYGGINPHRLRAALRTPRDDPYRALVGMLFLLLLACIIAAASIISALVAS